MRILLYSWTQCLQGNMFGRSIQRTFGTKEGSSLVVVELVVVVVVVVEDIRIFLLLSIKSSLVLFTTFTRISSINSFVWDIWEYIDWNFMINKAKHDNDMITTSLLLMWIDLQQLHLNWSILFWWYTVMLIHWPYEYCSKSKKRKSLSAKWLMNGNPNQSLNN